MSSNIKTTDLKIDWITLPKELDESLEELPAIGRYHYGGEQQGVCMGQLYYDEESKVWDMFCEGPLHSFERNGITSYIPATQFEKILADPLCQEWVIEFVFIYLEDEEESYPQFVGTLQEDLTMEQITPLRKDEAIEGEVIVGVIDFLRVHCNP